MHFQRAREAKVYISEKCIPLLGTGVLEFLAKGCSGQGTGIATHTRGLKSITNSHSACEGKLWHEREKGPIETERQRRQLLIKPCM